MNSPKKVFYIDHAVSGESGKLTAIGRGGNNEVSVGTRFVAVYKIKRRVYPDELETPAEIECTREVDLEVDEVTAYGKKMNFLPGNTTGCLVFAEQDTDLLPSGWVLTT